MRISHGSPYDEARSPMAKCNCSASGTQICLDVDTKPQVYAPQGAPHIMCDAVIRIKPATNRDSGHGPWYLATCSSS